MPVRITMDAGTVYRNTARWVAASLITMLTTFALVRLGANSTAAGMVFLVLVVWSSTQAGIKLSVYVAVLCALSFDYFFLPPVRSIEIVGLSPCVIARMADCALAGIAAIEA